MAVVDLVRQGLTNEEPTAASFISDNTMKVHLRNVDVCSQEESAKNP